ncbi:hypothetical protein PGQ11_010596 [Apiospora arundinis]|uniref:Uncharacterized protein n=1 Tax=Apiospora arundinis TaxID=335852 RepID=A0ABR2IA42_9PEZI
MCYNLRVYYDCPETHLQSSRGRLCSAPYQCGCWRRHDPDRLRRLHVQETLSPDLCPRCPAPRGCGGGTISDDEGYDGDHGGEKKETGDSATLPDDSETRRGRPEPSDALVQELRLAKRAMLVPRRVTALHKGDSLNISIRL